MAVAAIGCEYIKIFLIFQDGDGRRLGLSNSQNFIGCLWPDGPDTSLHQILSKLVVTLRRCCIFRIFKMATAAILDFWNREILLAIRVTMVKMHQHGIFCQNRSIGRKDIMIFDFPRWRPPPSWIVEFTKFYWLSVSGGRICIILPNFVKIGRFVAEILRFFEFSRWRTAAILKNRKILISSQPICLGHIRTTNSEYLGVSITVQNLVMIDVIVFIIWTF